MFENYIGQQETMKWTINFLVTITSVLLEREELEETDLSLQQWLSIRGYDSVMGAPALHPTSHLQAGALLLQVALVLSALFLTLP